MKKPAPAYRKLPGGGLTWAGLASLWLGSDHLLEVTSMIFHERYRRFFLPDIGAIIIRRTRVRLYWNLVYGVIGIGGSLLAGGIAYGATFVKDQEPRVSLWVLAGMVAPFALGGLILFFVNTLLGPTCRCHVRTSAGWHPLAAPSRLRRARRMVEQITPLLTTVQTPEAPPATSAETAETFP